MKTSKSHIFTINSGSPLKAHLKQQHRKHIKNARQNAHVKTT